MPTSSSTSSRAARLFSSLKRHSVIRMSTFSSFPIIHPAWFGRTIVLTRRFWFERSFGHDTVWSTSSYTQVEGTSSEACGAWPLHLDDAACVLWVTSCTAKDWVDWVRWTSSVEVYSVPESLNLHPSPLWVDKRQCNAILVWLWPMTRRQTNIYRGPYMKRVTTEHAYGKDTKIYAISETCYPYIIS